MRAKFVIAQNQDVRLMQKITPLQRESFHLTSLEQRARGATWPKVNFLFYCFTVIFSLPFSSPSPSTTLLCRSPPSRFYPNTGHCPHPPSHKGAFGNLLLQISKNVLYRPHWFTTWKAFRGLLFELFECD